MKAALKGVSRVDLPDGRSLPNDPADCWIVVTASIGVLGEQGADDFTLYVCIARRLERIVAQESRLWGRHLLIVERFDWTLVRDAIEKMCDGVDGHTWNEIASQLSQYGAWEF